MRFRTKLVLIVILIALPLVYMRIYPRIQIGSERNQVKPNEVQCFKDYMTSDELLKLAHQSSLLTNVSELGARVRFPEYMKPNNDEPRSVHVSLDASGTAYWEIERLQIFWFNAIDNFDASQHCPSTASSKQTPSP